MVGGAVRLQLRHLKSDVASSSSSILVTVAITLRCNGSQMTQYSPPWDNRTFSIRLPRGKGKRSVLIPASDVS